MVWGRVSGCELAYARGLEDSPGVGLPGPRGWTRLSEGDPLPRKGVRCEVVFGVVESWVGFGGLLRCQGWGTDVANRLLWVLRLPFVTC